MSVLISFTCFRQWLTLSRSIARAEAAIEEIRPQNDILRTAKLDSRSETVEPQTDEEDIAPVPFCFTQPPSQKRHNISGVHDTASKTFTIAMNLSNIY